MKNLSFFRVRAMLCLSVSRFLFPLNRLHRREQHRLQKTLDHFFNRQPPERFHYFSLLSEQCWRLQDPRYKTGATDTEFTEFLAQTTILIEAAYRYHRYARTTMRISPGPLIWSNTLTKIH